MELWEIVNLNGTSYVASVWLSSVVIEPHEITCTATIAGVTDTLVLRDTEFREIRMP